MRITTVTVGMTFNLGSYESLRIDATASVEPDESPAAVGTALHGFVLAQAERAEGAEQRLEYAAFLQDAWTPPAGYRPCTGAELVARVRRDGRPA